jgi:hypothetical protein
VARFSSLSRAMAGELSTTRIHRLLRPLRVSCVELDKHALGGCAASGRATYSRIHAWRPADKGPLALVRPPGAGGVRDADVSKRIYAVHAALKNVLQAAGVESERRRRPRLAALCAAVVGAAIQEEVDLNLREGVVSAEDEEEMAIIEEMYEYVPAAYRRSVPVSPLCTKPGTHARTQVDARRPCSLDGPRPRPA